MSQELRMVTPSSVVILDSNSSGKDVFFSHSPKMRKNTSVFIGRMVLKRALILISVSECCLLYDQ